MWSSRHDSAGTTVALMYCCFVLPNSKEGRSMEPRQLRLPGFTRFWALEISRVRVRELQPRRPVRQRIFVPIRAVEKKHALVGSDEPPLAHLPPACKHRTA